MQAQFNHIYSGAWNPLTPLQANLHVAIPREAPTKGGNYKGVKRLGHGTEFPEV